MRKRLLLFVACLCFAQIVHAEPLGPKKIFYFPPRSAALQSSRSTLSIQNEKNATSKTKRTLTAEESKAAAKRQRELADVLQKLKKMQQGSAKVAKKQAQPKKVK